MSTNASVLDRAETRHDVLQGYFDLIVDQAPVPVHVVDADFKITNVNRRWLDTLGYERSEVLGRPSTDFLSLESRERALRDVLPLFRRAGSSRSVGKNFETKDGRAVSVLLDAQVCSADDAQCHAFAVMRDPDDPVQDAEASATFTALRSIALNSPDVGEPFVARVPTRTDGSRPGLEVREAEASSREPLPRLTKREREVLQGLASGARNKEIAAELGTSVRTVRFHVENIYQKLDVHTRTQAARAAIERGLLTLK